jgi:acyl-CoA synthetase (AMP-forming)/AMP-acid ligase II
MGMLVHEFISSAVQRFGTRPATVDNAGTLSYADLWDRARRLASYMQARGVAPGDRVVVLMNNRNEWIEVDIAASMVGATRGRLNARDSIREFTWVLNDLKPSLVVIAPEYGDVIDTIRDAEKDLDFEILELGPGGSYESGIVLNKVIAVDRLVTPGDPYLVFHTSGTTGRYKGAVYTHAAWLNVYRNILATVLDDMQPGDSLLHAGPVTHMSGILIGPALYRGARSVMMDRFSPKEFFRAVETHGVTHCILAPAVIAALINEPSAKDHDLSSLKRIYYAAAPIAPANLVKAIEIFGPILFQGYGGSEGGTIFNTVLHPDEHVDALANHPQRLASAGRAIPFFDVGLFGLDGEPVADGEVGEIWVRGDAMSCGYWNNPEATRASFEGGWFHTGDLAIRDSGGFIAITDRKADVVISGGFNVYPREVEDVIASHPQVLEVVVIGVPDDRWGEAVKACVRLREGGTLTLEEVRDHCVAAGLASYKKPTSLDVVDLIPKSAVGKILRSEVRAPYWKGMDRNVG